MGKEIEAEPMSPSLKLPLLTIPTKKESSSNYHSELTSTPPPLHTSFTASIPFKWEQEPGKPFPCTALMTKLPSPTTHFPLKSLELPPRLQQLDSKVTKLHSPTNVLDGSPYAGRSSQLEGSFGKRTVGGLVLGEWVERKQRGGLFGSWGGCGNKEVVGGSFVFPAYPADYGSRRVNLKRWRVKRNASFSSFSQASSTSSHFWVSVYEGFKQVLPWRSKKLKKERHNF